MPKAHPCPADLKVFRKLVNMSPESIRSWAKDPRARCASFEQTRKRLPALASLRAKSPGSWNESDCRYARRVNSFNSRHLGQMKQFGCTLRETVALMNWGHRPKCPMPPMDCAKRDPKGPKPKKGPGDR
jgi:hypothetical protein